MRPNELEVVLPGGLLEDGIIARGARFLPLTGRIEQMLIDLKEQHDHRAGYVTSVLTSALDTVGNRPMDAERARNLCVADRQYLMVRLSAMLEGEQMWLKVDCPYCYAPFDVEVRRCDLPIKAAGSAFPFVTLRADAGELSLRVPCGADQEQISDLPKEAAVQRLLEQSITALNGAPPPEGFVARLSRAEIEAIDDALDSASPAVCNTLLVKCVECGQEQQAELDLYHLTGLHENQFYDEVHTLASHYHWNEEAILALPKTRRRRYLDLINRSEMAVAP